MRRDKPACAFSVGGAAVMNHSEQIEVVAYLIFELCDMTKIWESHHGISWNRLGELAVEADGEYGKLKELIGKDFGKVEVLP
jgi:hypothetical protein